MTTPADGSMAAIRLAADQLARQVRIAIADKGRKHDTWTLSGLLSRTREGAGVSLDALSDRCGIAKSRLWEMEQGRGGEPTVATLVKLSKGLGMPLMDLVWAVVAGAELNGEA